MGKYVYSEIKQLYKYRILDSKKKIIIIIGIFL